MSAAVTAVASASAAGSVPARGRASESDRLVTTLTLPTSDVGFALCVEKKPVHLKDLGLAGFVDHRVSWVLPNKMLLLTAGETCADPGNPHVFVEQRSDGAFQYVVVYPSDGEDPWRVKRPALTTADLPCAVSSGDECLRNNCTEKLGQCFAVFVATENAEVVVGNKEVWHPLEHDLEEHEKRNFRVPFADEKWAEEEGRKLVPLFDGVEGKDYIDGTKPGAVRTHFFEKDDSSSGGGGKVVVFGYPSCPCLVPVKEKSLVLELLASIWQVPGTRALHVATLSSTDSYFYVVATSAVTSPVTSPTNAAKVTYRVDVFQVDEDSGFDSDNSDDSDADEADGSPRPGGRSTPLYSPSSPLPSPVVKTPPRNALYHSDVSDDDDDDYEAQDATRVGKKSKVVEAPEATKPTEAYAGTAPWKPVFACNKALLESAKSKFDSWIGNGRGVADVVGLAKTWTHAEATAFYEHITEHMKPTKDAVSKTGLACPARVQLWGFDRAQELARIAHLSRPGMANFETLELLDLAALCGSPSCSHCSG